MMVRSGCIAALSSLLVVAAAAYRDTVPVIAWSSHTSSNLNALSNSTNFYSSSADLFQQLLQLDQDELCSFGSIIVVDQPGLSAADLKTSLYLVKQLSSVPSSLQIPYLPSSSSSSDSKEFESFKETIVEKCKSERHEISLGSRIRSETDGSNQVVGIAMPPLDTSSGKARREMFAESQRQLEKTIQDQTSSSHSYLIIYTSSISARMESGFDVTESLRPSKIHTDIAEAPINSTLPTGSLLHRYQFFTPGILIGFFVSFVILLPILFFSLYALASIQSPSRVDTVGSRTVSLNKKNQ